VRDLRDVRDLLHRGSDERRKAFPMRLPNDAQAPAELRCLFHGRIIGKRSGDLAERMIEGKIARDRFAESGWNEQLGSALLNVRGMVADRSDPARAIPHPMKDLPTAKRLFEVEIGRRQHL
jgi:hypothetical protein